VSLIERATRRSEATALGLEYERRARLVLASLDELDSFAAPETERRSVTISASAAVVSHITAPAIGMTTAELVTTSEIPRSLLAWAHSCHTGSAACGSCRGCVKHLETTLALGGVGY
jgi:7-cyano-7-deazaguanine synthase in queuosine biosynthesis